MASSSSGATELRTGLRILAVALLALLALVTTPPAAWSHAAFVSSRPEPGTRLTTTPGVVEIEFSEPLIADLSSLVVTDPDGRRWERTAIGQHSMQASLDTTALGVYEVEWKTVSPVDGHTLRGSYRFGVGVTPADVEAAVTTAPQTSDLLLAVPGRSSTGACSPRSGCCSWVVSPISNRHWAGCASGRCGPSSWR